MCDTEECQKLVTASINWFKTAEQVCSVLESLEREYCREEDWCKSEKANKGNEVTSKVTLMAERSSKHHDQKESFLKVFGGN